MFCVYCFVKKLLNMQFLNLFLDEIKILQMFYFFNISKIKVFLIIILILEVNYLGVKYCYIFRCSFLDLGILVYINLVYYFFCCRYIGFIYFFMDG